MKTLGNHFTQALKNLKISAFKFGHDKEPTYLKKVSEEWEPFGAIEGDLGKMVNIHPEAFLVAYKTPAGVFKKHYHKVMESGIMVQGSMIVYTPEGSFKVHEGESYTIPAEVWHSVKFLEIENLALVQFHPMFESGDWEAID